MKTIKKVIYMTIAIMFIACSNDDDNNGNTGVDPDPDEPTLAELRAESTTVLTSGDSKTWRISEAMLDANSNAIDITTNFNVVDDEFIFSGTGESGTIEWRQGNEIQTDATTNQETLLDNYRAPIVSSFQYAAESSDVVEADFGSCTFEINEDGSVTATINNADESVLNFTLVEKTAGDYASAPDNGLTFTQAFTFESNLTSGNAVGMIGSYSDNSFYIATREDELNNGTATPERIIKYNPATNTTTERLSFLSDFVSKQLHIVDNQLITIGGQYVRTYDLDLTSDPVIENHGRSLSRFGSAVQDNNAFIIGGDLDNIDGDKIFAWNLENQSLSEFATMPVPRSGARGAIVNNFMYVFGGTEVFFGDDPSDMIFKINMNNTSQIETLQMNKIMNFTYAQQFQNLIYVAGSTTIRDSEGVVIGNEATIGVLNTLDDSYQELTTNLVNNSGFDTIYQMCLFNGKMYIIYGSGTDNGGQFPEWQVLSADLN